MKDCRCTPTLKCCSEGIANSSLPQWEKELNIEQEIKHEAEAMKKERENRGKGN